MIRSRIGWAISASISWRGLCDQLARAVEQVENWQERTRQRRALAALDDAALKDIGLSRSEAAGECDKPFWRA